jgi:hypothetical protein
MMAADAEVGIELAKSGHANHESYNRGQNVYEEEIQFLRSVEDPEANHREPLDDQAIESLRRSFPGISEEYLAYLREIGPGSVREGQYEIWEPEFDEAGPLLSCGTLVDIGHDYGGDSFALDASNDVFVVVLDHESWGGGIVPAGNSFRAFIREQMLLGPDGKDQRER